MRRQHYKEVYKNARYLLFKSTIRFYHYIICFSKLIEVSHLSGNINLDFIIETNI